MLAHTCVCACASFDFACREQGESCEVCVVSEISMHSSPMLQAHCN